MTEQYVDINPETAPDAPEGKRPFSMLTRVVESRYSERVYQDETIPSKVAITWKMETTKGNIVERQWPTGIAWEGGKNVSADRKHLLAPMNKRSDAQWLLRKAIAADFPKDRVTNDISVFDGETFYMMDGTNDLAGQRSGNKPKLYPKQYHPEGWEAAKATQEARRAAREAQQNAPTYGSDSTYTPPAVVQSNDVLQTASEAITAILTANGPTQRIQIPGKLGQYVDKLQKETGHEWDKDFRKNVTAALWEKASIETITTNNPKIKFENEVFSLNN